MSIRTKLILIILLFSMVPLLISGYIIERQGPIAIVIGLIFLFVLLFALVLSRWLTSPLLEMAEATQGISQGNWPKSLSISSKDEIGILARSFNQMAEDLEIYHRELLRSKDYTDGIIDSLMDPLLVVSDRGKIEMMNLPTIQLLDREAKELKDQPIEIFFEGMEEGFLINREEHFHNREVQLKTGKGRIIPTLLNRSTLERGEIRKYVFSLKDICRMKEAEEKLRFAQFALDRAFYSVYWVNQDGDFIYANEEASRILGYTHEELLTMGVRDIDPVFPLEKWPDHWREIQEKGGVVLESVHQAKDGRTFPVRISANLLEFEGVEYNCAFVEDISEQKKREEILHYIALELSTKGGEELFEEIVRYLATEMDLDVVILGKLVEPDRARTLVCWEDGQFRENFEYSLEGSPCGRVVKDRYCSFPRDTYKNFPDFPPVAERKIEGYLGIPLVNSAGDPMGLLVVMHKKPLGNPERLLSFLRMFSLRISSEMERLQMEEALQKSEKQLRTLVESAPDAIFVEQGKKLVYINPAGLNLLGYNSLSEMEGMSLFDIWKERKCSRGDDRCQQINCLWEGRFLRKNGSFVDVEISYIENTYEGKPSFQAIVRDVSEFYRLREKSLKMEQMASLGELSATLAHEIRNPLSAIGLTFRNLMTQGFSENSLRQMQIVEKGIRRIESIIDGVMEFAKSPLPHFKKESIEKVLTSSLRFLQEEIEKKKIQVAIEMEGSLPPVDMDPSQIFQVFSNLFSNAIQAMESRGKLTIQGCQKWDKIEVRVEDTGKGIAPGDLDKIFNPFFTTRTDGTGLGLAVVSRILEHHRCKIAVESQKGKGTLFILEFRL